MAIEVKLEKYGHKKHGFLGFSWTAFFFNFFVPLFRGDFKWFLIFLLAIISFVVWFFIAKNYNRDYTNKLLNQGYMAAEDDDYALAILKKYGYLEYTNEELRDNNKMELYKNIIETVKKDEKKKLYIFITYIIVIILFNVVPAVIAYTRIGDITYLEFLQNLYK